MILMKEMMIDLVQESYFLSIIESFKSFNHNLKSHNYE